VSQKLRDEIADPRCVLPEMYGPRVEFRPVHDEARA
jgi:hypothetical protein